MVVQPHERAVCLHEGHLLVVAEELLRHLERAQLDLDLRAAHVVLAPRLPGPLHDDRELGPEVHVEVVVDHVVDLADDNLERDEMVETFRKMSEKTKEFLLQ